MRDTYTPKPNILIDGQDRADTVYCACQRHRIRAHECAFDFSFPSAWTTLPPLPLLSKERASFTWRRRSLFTIFRVVPSFHWLCCLLWSPHFTAVIASHSAPFPSLLLSSVSLNEFCMLRSIWWLLSVSTTPMEEERCECRKQKQATSLELRRHLIGCSQVLTKLVRFRRGKLLAKSANEYAKTAERARRNYRTAVLSRHTNEMFVSLVYGLLFAILCDENDSFYIINVANLFLDARIKNEKIAIRPTRRSNGDMVWGMYIRTETHKKQQNFKQLFEAMRKNPSKKISRIQITQRNQMIWFLFEFATKLNATLVRYCDRHQV